MGVRGGSLNNSMILYGAAVWVHSAKKNIEVLKKHKKRAARAIIRRGLEKIRQSLTDKR